MSEADLRARLHDIERHLREMPPHNASGSRDELERQRVSLQRQLAQGAAKAKAAGHAKAPTEAAPSVDPPDPRRNAPRSPAADTPPIAPSAFRRTTHIACGPVAGTDYGTGIEVPRDLHGGCRDVMADSDDGEVRILGLATITGNLDVERHMSNLSLTPGPAPATLEGQKALPGLRGIVAGAVDDTTTPAATVLLDLGVGGNLAAYGRMQAGRQAGKASNEVMRPDVLAVLGDSCRGWANDGEVAAVVRAGTHRPAMSPSEVPHADEAGWHDLGDLPPWWVRRRRRIDVLAQADGGISITSAFRDSWVDADSIQRSLHEWELDLVVDANGIITSAVATPRSLPFGACPMVADDVPGLVGAAVADLRHRTRDVLGGAAGCTHLNDLLSTIPAAVVAAARAKEA